MKKISIVLITFSLLILNFDSWGQSKTETNEFVQISMDLLSTVKAESDYQQQVRKYKSFSLHELARSLDSDNKRKAFWINTYNAYVQILLSEDSTLFEDRDAFFEANQINIAGQMLSLDFIEHGIIRGSKVKLALGYMNDPFASKLEKQFRVTNTDGRIHFALNCGAISCPSIAIYSAIDLNQELNQMTLQFLKRTTDYNKNTNIVQVTSLFSWFRGDFSDDGGIVGFLKKYDCIPKDSDPELSYRKYDWTMALDNFTKLE